MQKGLIVQKIVVGGVLIHNGKALILQRSENEKTHPGMWELPSGKKEPLEKTEDALVREFQEETGVGVTIIVPISVFDYQTTEGVNVKDSVQINFLVACHDSVEVKISREHQSYAWINERDVNRYNLSDATKIVLGKAFQMVI